MTILIYIALLVLFAFAGNEQVIGLFCFEWSSETMSAKELVNDVDARKKNFKDYIFVFG